MEVFGQLLGEIGKRPVNKDLRCRGRHIVEVYADTVGIVLDEIFLFITVFCKPHFRCGSVGR